jgi:competence ComEA-like helix-hairpin-helix protein
MRNVISFPQLMQKLFRRLAFFCAFGLIVACAAHPVTATKKHPPARPIDLNTATATQLEELPGVGPATAKAILDFRAKSGPFHRVEDLLSVHGISQKRFEKLRRYITIGPATHTQRKQPPKHS